MIMKIFISIYFCLSIVLLLNIIKRYVYHFGDSRSPYIGVAFIHTAIFCVTLFVDLIDYSFTPFTVYFIMFYPIMIYILLCLSRLNGYKTIKFGITSKTLINSILIICLVMLIVLILYLKYDNYPITNFGNLIYIHSYEYSLFTEQLFTTFFIMFFFLSLLIFNLIFDIIEKRRKLNIVLDIFSFVVFILCLLQIIFNFENNRSLWYVIKLSTCIIPMLHILKEYSSIINHSKGPDSRIYSIVDIVKTINFNSIGIRETYQLNLIKKILDSDKTLREKCFRRLKNSKKLQLLEYYKKEYIN